MTELPQPEPEKRRIFHRYRPNLQGADRPVANSPKCINLRSPREMAQMRKAGLAVWGAHQAAKALVRPGVTTFEIDAAIDEYFQRHNAIPLFKGVPGKVPFPAATCISMNDEVVHGIPAGV
jgi:methionine aminopeptidase